MAFFSNIDRAIISTLAYFDIHDYPLTREELWRWLWTSEPVSEEMFLEHLRTLIGQGAIQRVAGYYVLAGREALLAARERKIPVLEHKMRRAQLAAKKLRWIPFVQAVLVSNTVAGGTAEKESDIDFLVVVQAGRLYLARLLVTLVLSVFRLRRTKRMITNRMCLCFYVTDRALNLSVIALDQPDIYLMYWIHQLIPLYDPFGMYEKILTANQWTRRYAPHARRSCALISRLAVIDQAIPAFVRKFFVIAWRGFYGDMLEAQARALQQAKMKKNFASLQHAGDTRVVVNDTMLKFHENDRRAYYRAAWQARCRELKVEP